MSKIRFSDFLNEATPVLKNLLGNTKLTKALNEVLSKWAIKVDQLRKDEIHIMFPSKNQKTVAHTAVSSMQFVSVLKEFGLSYKGNDIDRRAINGEDHFVVTVDFVDYKGN